MSPTRSFSVLVFILSLFFACFAQAQAQPQGQGNRNGLTVPITGTADRKADAAGPFAVRGTFKIERFVSTADGVFAVGLLSITDEAGATNIAKNVALPVQTGAVRSSAAPTDGTGSNGRLLRTAMVPVQATGACEILNLVLGPLHLDLLGLVIDLNQVILNITAVAGAGNLLGNLLCAVVGLLDGTAPGTLGQLANLLNQLLAILG